MLIFSVDFDCKEKMLNLFKVLEREKDLDISLKLNTLEEAFINIGIDEEEFLK